MYNFSHFKENDTAKITAFLEKHPFAFLTGNAEDGKLVATQVPMLLEERDGQLYLQGHMMRNTDHHKAFVANPNVLAVFTGPHAYVSASWYSTPKMGSTWNYMSVHIQGPIRMMSDEEKFKLMQRLTLHFEDGNTKSPTVIDNLSPDYYKRMLPAIDGFEIKADSIDTVFKLSQDMDKASIDNIINELKKRDDLSRQVAEEMENI